MNAPALHCDGIVKRFGATTALDGATLSVAAGTVHALVGENGAGKSTLMNVVSGLLRPDEGRVEIFGAAARFGSPLDAAAAGIGMVHQHFLLAGALTVAENVALGLRGSPFGWRFDRRAAEERIEKLAAETGLYVDPQARVDDLSVGLRQRVEILKALARGARILLLDEPTAVLAPSEVRSLFGTLQKLRAEGRTIVCITHKLDEVFRLAGAVTVLRRGRTVFAGPLSGIDAEDLAQKMVGEAATAPPKAMPREPGPVVLRAKDLTVPAEQGTGLREAAFELRGGEILGVAGVEGNGQEELAAALAGLLAIAPPGRVELCGEEITRWSVRARTEAGLALIPADRQHEGLVLELTLAENLVLREVFSRQRAALHRGPFLDHARIEAHAHERLGAFGVVPPDPRLPAGSLSGGNQQKVVAARELSGAPRAILACNPTRGLDIAAAAAVHERLRAAAASGAGVLLVSSDLDEILLLSDSIAVLYGGRLRVLGARAAGLDKEAVGRAMVGAAEADTQSA
ncbi:MAG: ABC transporter ATP-binding protein [Planctomycetes bacterium]|nr:ABC transporter ATP-binding protein [Planctomycetota bacterium]